MSVGIEWGKVFWKNTENKLIGQRRLVHVVIFQFFDLLPFSTFHPKFFHFLDEEECECLWKCSQNSLIQSYRARSPSSISSFTLRRHGQEKRPLIINANPTILWLISSICRLVQDGRPRVPTSNKPSSLARLYFFNPILLSFPFSSCSSSSERNIISTFILIRNGFRYHKCTSWVIEN